MKKKAVEKVEMKESLLKGEALALNDAELEGAAGGTDNGKEMGVFHNWTGRVPAVNEGELSDQTSAPLSDVMESKFNSPEQKELERIAAGMLQKNYMLTPRT